MAFEQAAQQLPDPQRPSLGRPQLPEKWLRPPLLPGNAALGAGGNPAGAAELAAQMMDGPPTLHPTVAEVIARKHETGHEGRLEVANDAVIGENMERGRARGADMIDDDDPTIVQHCILGGGPAATMDAATLPRGQGEVVGVSLPACADRAPADPSATGTGQQRLNQWSTQEHQPAGQTGREMLPYETAADGTPLRDADGRLIQRGGLAGLAVHPADLQPDPNAFVRSSELSLATAETLRQSGVPIVPGRPVGAVKLAPATAEERQEQGWPENAKARVEVELLGPNGRPIIDDAGQRVTETIYTTGTLDICVGMGPPNKLNKDPQRGNVPVTETDERQLEAAGDLVSAEAFLGGQGNANGENVLVFGGGPTASWVVQKATAEQAVDGAQEGEAVWAARPKLQKPEKTETNPATGERRLTAFGELERKIADAVSQNPGRPVPEEWTAKYNEMVAENEHRVVSDARDRVTTLESVLMVMPTGPERAGTEAQLGDARKALAKVEQDCNPFGKENARNAGTQESVPRIDKDILKVTPTDDGKVLVTFEDGSQRRFDKVINSIGQNPEGEDGPAQLVGDLPLVPLMETDPVTGYKYPVGLQTENGEVRVLGAAAWQLLGKVRDGRKRKEFEDAVRARAAHEVSENSRDVFLGFEAMGDSPARANHQRTRHVPT